MDLLMEVTVDGDDPNLPIEVPPEVGESQDIAIEVDELDESDQTLASNDNENLKVLTPSKSVRKSTSTLLLDFAEESDDESGAKLKNRNVSLSEKGKERELLDLDEVENLIALCENAESVIEKVPLFKDGDQPAIIITHRKSKDQEKNVSKETENGVTSSCPSDSEAVENDVPVREKASVRTFSSNKSSSSVMVLDIDPIHDIHSDPKHIKKEIVSKTDVKKGTNNVLKEAPNHSFKKKAAKAFIEKEKEERKESKTVDKEIHPQVKMVKKMTVCLTNIDYALQEISYDELYNSVNITKKLLKKVNPSILNKSIDHSKDPTQDLISVAAKKNHGLSSVSNSKNKARAISEKKSPISKEKKSPISKGKKTVEKLTNKTSANRDSKMRLRLDLNNIVSNSGSRRRSCQKESFQNILKSPSPIMEDLDVTPIVRSTPRKRTSSGLQKDNKPLSQKRKATGEGNSTPKKKSVHIEDVDDTEEINDEPSQIDIKRSSESPERSGHKNDNSFLLVEDTNGKCLFDSRNNRYTANLIVKVFSNGYEQSTLRVNTSQSVKEGGKSSNISERDHNASHENKLLKNCKTMQNGEQTDKDVRDKTPKRNTSLEIQTPEIGPSKTRKGGKDPIKNNSTSRSDKVNQKLKIEKDIQMKPKASTRSKELQPDKILSIYKESNAQQVTGSRRKSLKIEQPPLMSPDISSKFSLRDAKLCLKKLSDRECELGGKPTFDDMFPEVNVSSDSLSWKTPSANDLADNVHEEIPFSIAAVLNSLEED